MTECACRQPRVSPNSRRNGTCVRCSGRLDPSWVSSDETLAAFLDHLASTIPGWPEAAGSFDAFRRQVQARERAGRETFGFAYLSRDNPAEGLEEAADLAIYAYLDTLKALREGEDDELALALTAARKAWEAHEALNALLSRRRA